MKFFGRTMFKAKTTLVLGAGASWSYGYPLGSELVTALQIRAKKIGARPWSPVGRLQAMLEFYDPVSIDSFLEHYRDDTELVNTAKRLIAQELLVAGRPDRFLRGAQHKGALTNWYRFLWDGLVAGMSPEEICEEPLKFDVVTFNYDSSLEHYLYSRITSEHSMFNGKQQSKMLEAIRGQIHHVYGCLLDYSWLGGTIDNSFLSEGGKTEETANSVLGNIKLIGERKESDFTVIKKVIREAGQVIFLGFGFDQTNVGETVLDLKSCLKPRSSGGLTYRDDWLPVVKYTNVGDSDVVTDRVAQLTETPPASKDDRMFAGQAGYKPRRVSKSTQPVYQAIENDFSITDY